MNELVRTTIDSLRKNGMEADYFENAGEAVKALLEEIGSADSVGIGGSVTVSSLEIPRLLLERGNKVYFHWLENTPEKMDEARTNAARADVYLTSTNALTAKGQLVNTDGTGNRVASMIYGPRKVIVICGVNKLVEDLDGAFLRVKKAAYKNAKRLKLNTPCAINEACSDCSSPQRICSVTTIIEKKPGKTGMKVYIIGEELGF